MPEEIREVTARKKRKRMKSHGLMERNERRKKKKKTGEVNEDHGQPRGIFGISRK
jgi:hypothetical protein